MKIKTALSALALLLAVAPGARAALPTLSLDLASVERATLDGSHELAALSREAEAATYKADGARAVLYPKLAADGNYRWVEHVPDIQLGPTSFPFGTNDNWTVGVSLNWNLLDSGLFKQIGVVDSLLQAKQEELFNAREGLRLRARLAYFQTQLAAERVRLLANSVVLAQSQASDLALRLKAGTSSRLDALSAANDELARRVLLRAARTDLASALRDLYALSGVGKGSDPSIPGVVDVGAIPQQVETPTLLVQLDSLDNSLQSLSPAASVQYDPAQSSRLRQLSYLRDAARAQAVAAFTGHYPKASMSARYSDDYPDAVFPRSANQTTLGVSASLPLYSFGAVSDQVGEQDAAAAAAGERIAAQATDVERDLLKSKDRVASLQAQLALNQAQVQQTSDLADLEFKAYKIGGATYLEVQSASLRALEASTDLVTTKTEMLIELATLDASSR
jgi:outer membrane protein